MPFQTALKRLFFLLSVLLGSVFAVSAQANMLANPSFEQGGAFGNYRSTTGDGNFTVAAEWNGWITLTPRNEPWQNVPVFGFPHFGALKRSGTYSQDLGRSGGTFTAGVFQTVYNIPEGAKLRASVWVYQENAEGTNARTRIGIASNTNDPLSAAVVWSPYTTAVNSWQQITVETTVGAGNASVFIIGTQDTPNGQLGPNKIYIDDAELITTGSGTPAQGTPTLVGTANPNQPTPVPPTPTLAVANFVSPQNARPDGSIVHVVQSGDTLASIAFAYGITLDEIRTLNNLRSGSFIFPGQEIIVRMANPNPPTATPAPTNTPAPATATRATSGGFVVPTNPARTPVSGSAVIASSTPQPTATERATMAPTNAPTERATMAPTNAPTERATMAPTNAPTERATMAPTNAPTELPAEEVTSVSTEPPTEEKTPAPLTTVTDAPPAPVQSGSDADPLKTTAEVCVLMFEDANQNRIQNPNESLIAGGVIVLREGTTDISSYQTNGVSEPFCFTDLSVGTYTAIATAPEGYGLTSPASLVVSVQAGTSFRIIYGVAKGVKVADVPTPNAQTAVTPPTETETRPDLSNILGFIVIGVAGVVLVGGIALALLVRRMN